VGKTGALLGSALHSTLRQIDFSCWPMELQTVADRDTLEWMTELHTYPVPLYVCSFCPPVTHRGDWMKVLTIDVMSVIWMGTYAHLWECVCVRVCVFKCREWSILHRVQHTHTCVCVCVDRWVSYLSPCVCVCDAHEAPMHMRCSHLPGCIDALGFLPTLHSFTRVRQPASHADVEHDASVCDRLVLPPVRCSAANAMCAMCPMHRIRDMHLFFLLVARCTLAI